MESRSLKRARPSEEAPPAAPSWSERDSSRRSVVVPGRRRGAAACGPEFPTALAVARTWDAEAAAGADEAGDAWAAGARADAADNGAAVTTVVLAAAACRAGDAAQGALARPATAASDVVGGVAGVRDDARPGAVAAAAGAAEVAFSGPFPAATAAALDDDTRRTGDAPAALADGAWTNEAGVVVAEDGGAPARTAPATSATAPAVVAEEPVLVAESGVAVAAAVAAVTPERDGEALASSSKRARRGVRFSEPHVRTIEVPRLAYPADYFDATQFSSIARAQYEAEMERVLQSFGFAASDDAGSADLEDVGRLPDEGWDEAELYGDVAGVLDGASSDDSDHDSTTGDCDRDEVAATHASLLANPVAAAEAAAEAVEAAEAAAEAAEAVGKAGSAMAAMTARMLGVAGHGGGSPDQSEEAGDDADSNNTVEASAAVEIALPTARILFADLEGIRA